MRRCYSDLKIPNEYSADQMRMKRQPLKFRFALMLFALILAGGCSTSGTSIMLGQSTKYPRTNPQSVELLLAAPAKSHEAIALVEGIAETFDYPTEDAARVAAVLAMKKQAARTGAHAVILVPKTFTAHRQVSEGNTAGAALSDNVASGFTTRYCHVFYETMRISGTAIRYQE